MDQTISDELVTNKMRKAGDHVVLELKIRRSGIEMMSLKTGWKHECRCLQAGKIRFSVLRKHHS